MSLIRSKGYEVAVDTAARLRERAKLQRMSRSSTPNDDYGGLERAQTAVERARDTELALDKRAKSALGLPRVRKERPADYLPGMFTAAQTREISDRVCACCLTVKPIGS